jgi:vacuolar-type H+-ATPase subunit E/Vma4
VPLDRQSIEKRDFPIGRRGYDPEAVDAHLAWIAQQLEELRISSRSSTQTLATAAGEQVRAIVEAAAASAGRIEAEAEAHALTLRTQAENHARKLRDDAAADADAARSEATAQARAYVSSVSESTAEMMRRLEAMRSELSNLTDSLRTGANRLNDGLQLLEGNFDEVRGAVTGREVPVGEASEPAGAAEYEKFVSEPAEDEAQVLERAGAAIDVEGARLIALNMALNGTSREETDRYLAINFELGDRARLLDEVYASVER